MDLLSVAVLQPTQRGPCRIGSSHFRLSVCPRVSFFRVPEGRRGASVSAFEASDEHLFGLVT